MSDHHQPQHIVASQEGAGSGPTCLLSRPCGEDVDDTQSRSEAQAVKSDLCNSVCRSASDLRRPNKGGSRDTVVTVKVPTPRQECSNRFSLGAIVVVVSVVEDGTCDCSFVAG